MTAILSGKQVTSVSTPVAASLENPLYYLENADTVVRWILDQHSDLLLDEEATTLNSFLALPTYQRALLVRMITRIRDHFRYEQLTYPEIPQPPDELIKRLVDGNWITDNPSLNVTDLCQIFRKEEIYQSFATQLRQKALTKSSRKLDMEVALFEIYGEVRQPLRDWQIAPGQTVVSLTISDLFERVRLMFFGNLHQSWSEFVITELGHQHYESVSFSASSRAFHSRQEVDNYLELYYVARQLDEGRPAEMLWDEVPRQKMSNPWLDERRRRILYRLGHCAERNGNSELALEAYRCSWNEESRIRYFRVLEKRAPPGDFLDLLMEIFNQSSSESEQQLLARIIKRANKNHSSAHTASRSGGWDNDSICLSSRSRTSIEQQVADFYSGADTQCYYVENSLFNSLLGLLLWPAVFAPVQGAFFHPFQSGPADLYREDFVSRRQHLVKDCLATLQKGSYQANIRQRWNSKQGISCALINWQVVSRQLLDLTLSCIPADHLQHIFSRLLSDLKRHRSGLPDLIRFWPNQQRYELIEVKGPGDRLQDHQKLWLNYFSQHNIPARVCSVCWTESGL